MQPDRPADKRICKQCIGDAHLRSQAAADSCRGECAFCGKRRQCTTIGALADLVREPLEFAYRFGDRYWEGQQEGEDLTFIIQEEAGIDYDAAEALTAVLIDTDPADPREGGEPFFTSDESYVRTTLFHGEHFSIWKDFEHRVKHERRYFDGGARDLLAKILGTEDQAGREALPTVFLGTSEAVNTVYRARLAPSEAEARRFLAAPSRELGPPPIGEIRGGRMNATGIPAFYGTLSIETAVAEVRPPVGGEVAVAAFEATRKLRVLDLNALAGQNLGSIFDPEFQDLAFRQTFLSTFLWLITRPIQPHVAQIEYIPTQAVAEYFSSELGFDGLLYASAQTGDYSFLYDEDTTERDQDCVVLFRDAGVVQEGHMAVRPATDEWGLPTESTATDPGLRYKPGSLQFRRVTQIQIKHEQIAGPVDALESADEVMVDF